MRLRTTSTRTTNAARTTTHRIQRLFFKQFVLKKFVILILSLVKGEDLLFASITTTRGAPFFRKNERESNVPNQRPAAPFTLATCVVGPCFCSANRAAYRRLNS